jgi:hypothetical protein
MVSEAGIFFFWGGGGLATLDLTGTCGPQTFTTQRPKGQRGFRLSVVVREAIIGRHGG